MIKEILLSILILCIIYSCANNSNSVKKNKKIEQLITKEDSLKFKYKNIMKKKEFSLVLAKPCEDALTDTIYKDYECVVDLVKHSNDSLNVNSFFKAACCQEFMGDYQLMDSILYFTLENVNDEVCTCICWYKYSVKFKNVCYKPRDVIIKHYLEELIL